MNSLETQVGQIFISDKRLSKSFVSLLSERVPETSAEIFSLVEIPILNPSAWPEYEKLAKSIQTVLRRNFRRDNENAFENSIAQINDELAKLAASGQTSWVGKMNACLAVRQNDNLFVSTTGKIHAYLFRDKQLADIADSPSKINPLKTFENFAVGKVAKKDFLIFTTHQLFNYISIERLKDILAKSELASACQNIAEIIKNLADETISFGTFILELGTAKEPGVESVLKFTSPAIPKPNFNFTLPAIPSFAFLTTLRRFIVKLKNFKPKGMNLKDVNPLLIAKRAKDIADIEKIKALPKAKKFFLISGAVFAVILIINIFVAIHISGSKKAASKYNSVFEDVEQKITDANSAYIYNDKAKAMELLNQAQQELATLPDNKNINDKKARATEEVTELQASIGGLKIVDVQEIGKYSGALNKLRSAGGEIFAVNTAANLFVPFKNNAFEEGFTLTGSSSNVGSNGDELIYTDNEGKIYSVDPGSKSSGQEQGQIPVGTGLVFYGSPTKAYTLDTNTDQILVSTVTNDSGAVNYLKEAVDLSQALDLAIDGSVYVLFPDRIKKFTSGQEKSFTDANLKYSNNSKIYADNGWKYIYILDPGLKKIIVLDKNGNIKAQYTSTQFTDLKDAVIDEQGKTIYILNGSSILKFQTSI
jgi:hypothetical protein